MRLDRLLETVILLLNRRQVTARELAERFEVSVRTVYRDIEAINAAGVPIIATQGHGGGFTVMDNYTVDRRVLSLDDMRSILTALNGLRSSIDHPELGRVIEKIASLIPGDQVEAFSRSMEMLVVEMTPWGLAGKRRETVRLVHQAILETRLLEFSYYNQCGERTRRLVEPMTLLYKGRTWYLFGWCTLRGAFRIFRLSRMRELRLLLRGFRRREASYRDHLDLDMPPEGTALVDLYLRFRPEARVQVEDFFMEEDIVPGADGGLEVRTAFPDGDWVVSMLLAYGPAVEVLEPPALRERVRRQAEATAALYRPGKVDDG